MIYRYKTKFKDEMFWRLLVGVKMYLPIQVIQVSHHSSLWTLRILSETESDQTSEYSTL